VVLLDALGTLVELPPPAPALVEELAARGVTVTEEEAARAIGAEIAYYRAHLDEASDAAGLAALRGRCTEVLRDALPPHARDVADLQQALLGALRFRAYAEAAATLAELRSRGLTLVVVSNWDVSLHEVLARTGLAPFVDAVVTSAEHGAAKPAPSIFAAALERAGARPEEALHVGDSVEADVAGARAAGIEPVLVVRDGAAPPDDGTRTVDTLASLVGTLSPSPTWEIQPERPAPPPHAPPPAGRERTGEYAWHPWTAPVALVAALAIALLGGGLVAVIAALLFDAEIEDTPPGVLMAGTVVQDLGFVAAAIIFARLAFPPRPEHFGLRRTRVWRALGIALAIYFAYGLLAGLWSQVIDLGEPEDQLEDLGVETSDVLLALGAILVCVVAPVVEEFFFRGFFFAALRNWRGVWPAAIITGIIFGGIHVGSAEAGALVPLMVFGLGLCLLYQWTGSLYPCIGLHALNNSIAFGVAVGWDWQIPLLLAGSLLACAAVTIPVAARLRDRLPPPPPAVAGG
jgi:HAD superfamily hydrolase (TIGR01549 family)